MLHIKPEFKDIAGPSFEMSPDRLDAVQSELELKTGKVVAAGKAELYSGQFTVLKTFRGSDFIIVVTTRVPSVKEELELRRSDDLKLNPDTSLFICSQESEVGQAILRGEDVSEQFAEI